MNVIIFCVFMKPWDVPWDSVWETLGFGSQFWEISTMILGFRKILAGNTGLDGKFIVYQAAEQRTVFTDNWEGGEAEVSCFYRVSAR